MARKNLNIKAVEVATGKVKIYESKAAAAKALNVDASNIGKVVRGDRQSAGGYKFVETLESPTTKSGKAARRKQRESSEHMEFINAVHDRLKEINQRYFNAVKEDVYASDPVLQKLMSHADYFGMRKRGGYDISIGNIKKFSTQELENLLKVLNTEEKKYVKIAERKKRTVSPAALAATFGISVKQVNQYKDLIPYIFDLLHLAREDQFFRYSDVQDAIYEVMQRGENPETLQEYIDMIYEAYWSSDKDYLGEIIGKMTAVDEEYRDSYD